MSRSVSISHQATPESPVSPVNDGNNGIDRSLTAQAGNVSKGHEHSSEQRDWRERLRAAHVRVTSQRLAVLSTLDAHPHSTAGEIVRAVDGHDRETLTVQGAYVMLQQLEAARLVRRVSLPDSPSARWETRVGDNHHHVQCIMCGRVEDVDCVVGQAPCLTPSDTHGMRILEAQIVFRGICSDCAAKAGMTYPENAAPTAAPPVGTDGSISVAAGGAKAPDTANKKQ